MPNTNGVFLKRDCPGCGSPRRHDKSEAASIPPAETLDIDRFSRYWEASGGRRVFFSYYRCVDCGLLYCPLTLSPTQLSALYHLMGDNTHGVALPVVERTQKGYFDLLRRHSNLQGDYLEIGPDLGLFARLCAREGRLGKLYLFEPNTSVRPALEANLAGSSCEIQSHMFEPGAVPEASISIAIAINLADHLQEPASFLASIIARLTSSGVLLLVVHDESSCSQKPPANSRRRTTSNIPSSTIPDLSAPYWSEPASKSSTSKRLSTIFR